jgi:hypothetical protein
MFAFSPWEWPINNSFLLYSLNFFYLLAFFLGYKFGFYKYKVLTKPKRFKFSIIFKISLITNLLFVYQKFLFKLKVPSISFSELIAKIAIGFKNPSIAYAEKHLTEFSDFNTLSNPVVLLYFLLLPLMYFSIPLGIYYWKKITMWQKTALLFLISMDILSYIAIGTNKGIFDYIIMIPFLIIARKPASIILKKISKKQLVLTLIVFSIFLLGISYFVEGNKGRKKDNFRYDTSINQFVNEDSFILNIIPNSFDDSYIALDNYLTQGYYAMDLALGLDFESTLGFGHSGFLMSISDKIFGKDYIYKKTYQKKIEETYGYSSRGRWHSFYTWMANDLSFFGVIIFVFALSFFLSQVWIDIVLFQNPFAITLLPLFCIMIFYFSANNQVLGNQGSSFIFWSFFILWLKNRGKVFIND